MDPAGLARGQTPGRPRRGRRVPAPASARRDWSRRNRHGCHSSRGTLTPIEDELRASQAQPRSMTRIRQPGSGKPGGTSVWETGQAPGSAAGAGASGSYLVDLAPSSVRAAPAPRSVVWGEAAALISSVVSSSGSWQTARVSAGCSALSSCISERGCPCREPARPARRQARHGALRSGDREGDRGGRRCRLRDGIRQTCAGHLLPATTWSLPPGRARHDCSRAGPYARARCRRWWCRRCHGRE